MEVKKKFKLVDNYKEEAFLNDLNKEGYLLTAFDGETYKFEKTDKKYYYLIEFFYNKLSDEEITNYKKLGYTLLVTFKSVVSGYYYYFFVSRNEVVEQDRQLKDRYENLLKSKQRVDRFTSIIFVATFSLFTYLYFKSRNEIYTMVLLLIVLLGGYFGHIYIETIKRLNQYAQNIVEKDGGIDGDNERRSE